MLLLFMQLNTTKKTTRFAAVKRETNDPSCGGIFCALSISIFLYKKSVPLGRNKHTRAFLISRKVPLNHTQSVLSASFSAFFLVFQVIFLH